jgi:hypothetical protein
VGLFARDVLMPYYILHAMISYADPVTFAGQLQRGRGSAARRACAERGAGEAVYDCVVRDPRWDHQDDERDSYLAS